MKLKFLNRFYVLIFTLIFLLTISVNTKGILKNYNEFYYTKEAGVRLKNNWAYQKLRYVNKRPVSTILSYTGLDTGFGFFAPNVASEYVTEFHVYDKDSMLLSKEHFPYLKRKESRLRLSSSFLMFQEYLEDEPDSIKLKKCNILLKGLSLKVLAEEKKAAFVSSRVYLYHYPLLSQLDANPNMEPILKLLKSEIYTTDDYWKGY